MSCAALAAGARRARRDAARPGHRPGCSGCPARRPPTLVEAGDVAVDGIAAPQVRQGHRRLLARGHAARAAGRRSTSCRRRSPGLRVVYSDDDIVVVDKPVGVAAHPSPGWTGPTVIGGLAAIGHRSSHQRRRRAAGHRAPARRRHHRADGGGQERAGVQRAQARVQGARGRQALPRRGAGPPRPAARHHRRADRPAPDARLQVGGGVRRQAERHPLRHARGVPGRRACSTSSWRPAAPTRSGCTSPRCATRASATSPTAPTPRWPPGWADPAVAARPGARLHPPRAPATRCASSATTLTTWSARSPSCGG